MELSPDFTLAKDTCANDRVYHTLGRKVATELLGVRCKDARIKLNPLSSNYFSFTFSIRVETPEGIQDVFVKIPKDDLRGCIPEILPITEKDRKMAHVESASLRLLEKQWPDNNFNVSWVKLIDEIPEFNAIVTERIIGKDAFIDFRRYDIRRRFGFLQDANKLRQSMMRLGGVLAHFHHSDTHKSVFQLSTQLPKIEKYCQKLKTLVGGDLLTEILQKLHSMSDMSKSSLTVPTIKGLDIRNILVDPENRFYLLDPGRIKSAFREADLARFITTYRMLHWGSMKLILARTPDKSAELAFIQAYGTFDQCESEDILRVYLIKEQLKHWYNVHNYVQLCNWHHSYKRLVSWFYINPFFSRLLKKDLKKLYNYTTK